MTTASEVVGPLRATEPRLLVREIDELPDVERAFVHLYGASANAFWLDSSRLGERGRFSFMGDCGGPLAAIVTYDVEERLIRVRRRDRIEVRRESVFDFLGEELEGLRLLAGALPFGLDCGCVGYLGYELKADCGATAAHRATTPDAAFVFADRLIAFDHEERRTYLVAFIPPPNSELHQIPYPPGWEFDAVRSGERWIEEAERRLAALPPLSEPEPQGPV